MSIDSSLLQQCFSATKSSVLQDFIDPLNKTFDAYNINTKLRLAAFIAQIEHESGDLQFLIENLNYNAAGLLKVFPKYFTAETAAECSRNPQKIANIVYANRMGNGDPSTNDGWNFRGSGVIQITGEQNYKAFADSMGMSLDDVQAYIRTPEGACMSAGWFWDQHNLNDLADQEDFQTITKRINGGLNGEPDREARYTKLLQILSDLD